MKISKHPCGAATLLLAVCLLTGCGLFRPAPNVAFVVEPGGEDEGPEALAETLRARLASAGAPAGEVVVKGRTVEVRTHLEAPDTAVPLLLRPFHVEFALADDTRLVTLTDALCEAHPGLTQSPVPGRVQGNTVCSQDRAALEEALAATPIANRVWRIELQPGAPTPTAKPTHCAALLEPTVLDNKDIAAAEAFENELSGGMDVRVEFREKAGERFGTLTAGAVQRRLAIVLDGDVLSMPVIQEKIGGGTAHITMSQGPDSRAEAEALAVALGTRPLASAPQLREIKLIGE